MAFSSRSDFNRNFRFDKLGGGEGRLAGTPDLLDDVFRRDAIGIGTDAFPDSATAATIAATLLAVEVTLFRRVTLLGGTREPDETECEWPREFGGRGSEPDMDERC